MSNKASKRLIVMRHAKSSWKQPQLEDHERKLNKRGCLSAQAIARKLHQMNWVPTTVISSDAVRTRQTWSEMQTFLEDIPASFHRSLYHAGWDQATVEVCAQISGEASVLLLGHNPGWSWMVGDLTGRPTELKTADAVLLEPKKEELDWVDLMTLPGQWNIAHLLRSRTLLEYPELY